MPSSVYNPPCHSRRAISLRSSSVFLRLEEILAISRAKGSSGFANLILCVCICVVPMICVRTAAPVMPVSAMSFVSSPVPSALLANCVST